MLVPHLHLCNRAGFRDNAAKLGKLGHRGIFRDCPGQTGTLGNYALLVGITNQGNKGIDNWQLMLLKG